MRVLVSIPVSRNLPRCFQSVHNLQWDGEIRFAFERGGDLPTGNAIGSPNRAENCLRKAQFDRAMMLNNEFDAMLHIDDDMLIPPDALLKLAALNAPVAYGLYVWRNQPHYWNICHSISDDAIDIYGMHEGDTQRAWGQVLDVAGVGTACILIRREVIERIPFVLRNKPAGYDYFFAVDCCRAGIRQVCDTTVECGHVDPENRCVYWPTPEGYMTEPLVGEM